VSASSRMSSPKSAFAQANQGLATTVAAGQGEHLSLSRSPPYSPPRDRRSGGSQPEGGVSQAPATIEGSAGREVSLQLLTPP
jgi:hypothetical protein